MLQCLFYPCTCDQHFKVAWFTQKLQDFRTLPYVGTTARPHLQLSKQGPLLPVVLHLGRWLQQIALQVFPIQHILSMTCHEPVKKFVKLFYAHFWKRTLCLEDVKTFMKLSKCLAIIWSHQKKVMDANLATEIWSLLSVRWTLNYSSIFWKCHNLWHFDMPVSSQAQCFYELHHCANKAKLVVFVYSRAHCGK